ncbi:poly-beta-1,6 N-acetyl-D-glucosamine synthase [Polynucleobacter paneuropaeus]|nr:poly-beta-1,6 N-acetyl-D-glucosamine synthase [Polynucleobacter paneuropaeus]
MMTELLNSVFTQKVLEGMARFCFGYPFIMSWYWIAGSLLYWFIRERHRSVYTSPPKLRFTPLVSVLLPCFNEEKQLRETMAVLMDSNYPNYEVIAINDGSSDNTGKILEDLVDQYPKLRIAHLVENQGKSTALNAGLFMARGDYLVCIDGDALLDPHAIDWLVFRFLTNRRLGGISGNPRIRNRSSLLGKLQVGEFSSIVGMIKRTQSLYGTLFTVSGVVCAFRKVAVMEAGLWSPEAMTDDVDLTLRIQAKKWAVGFEPHALCWILMPETFSGLWKQRVRWSEGGSQAMINATKNIFLSRPLASSLLLLWSNFFISTIWAFSIVIWFTTLNVTQFLNGGALTIYQNFLPDWWGIILGSTYLLQSFIGLMLDRQYEKRLLRSFAWIIWYPLVYWCVQTCSCVVGFTRALFRPADMKGTWVSPDRGIR